MSFSFCFFHVFTSLLSRLTADGNTATAPASFSVTFDGAEKQSDVLFSHRVGSSGNTMDIYCMALDITSDENVDYRAVAMDKGINIWKTTLKIGVSTTD